MAENEKMIKGSHILMRSLKEAGVEVIWGYPGGQIMPVYDALYDYRDVFLMDEPFSALDEQTRHKLDEDIVELWKEKKKTVVFVTHSVEEAIMVSTRIIMLSNSPGRIVGEWDLSDRSKDMSRPENIRLKNEIMDRMPLCSCALCR